MTDQAKINPRQVQAYQSLRPVAIDAAATCGAQIGVNLLLPDGTVGTLAKLQALFGTGTTSSSITTTDDVEEGQWNLWFTNRRAQDAVGGILANSANVTLTYVGGTSITADLTDLTDIGTGALLAITRDGKGRVTGTKAATITGTAGQINVANGNASASLPTISLADVSVTSGGTLKKRAFDAKGRLSQESAATTDDLTEGSTNLYFTAARVRAAVLTGISLTTSAVIAATDTVLGAFGKLQAQITDNLLPKGYIDGLQMQWVSGTALTVSSGAAYIEGSSKVLRATSAIAKTGLSLSASTWYHVYLYDNAGTPDIEIVTTAPDSPYYGTARSKTGDASRRYIGSIVSTNAGLVTSFSQQGGIIKYQEQTAAYGAAVLLNGTSTTPVDVFCSGQIPLTSRSGLVNFSNTTTNSTVVLSNSDCNYVLSSSNWLFAINGSSRSGGIIALSASRSFNYAFLNTVTSGGLLAIVVGYIYER